MLFQLCFSVSPPTVARPASLPLPLRMPGQGMACGAGCWLPEGVSDPAPLPPQYLLGHWFLSRSLPQRFISDLHLPLDFVHFWRFWNSSTERAAEKKTTFLWVLSRLASISVAAVFRAIASALKFVAYIPVATEMCASSALYFVGSGPECCISTM